MPASKYFFSSCLRGREVGAHHFNGIVSRLLFISNLSAVEWMEFRSLHDDALAALERAAGNAMLTVQATSALRVLFVRAKLI